MTASQLETLYTHSPDIKQALAKIQSAINTPYRSLIGLTGGPGSGKSTLAEYLTSHFSEQPQQVISLSMDGFHLSKAQLSKLPNSEEAFARRGAPWTFDSHAFAERIKSIHQNHQIKDVLWPSFDHSIGDPVEDDLLVSKNTKVILIEGLYLLYPQDGWQMAKPLFDEHWFLDVPIDIATERLAKRHMAAWGFSHEQAMNRIQQSDGLNAELVLSTKNQANWLIRD